MRLSVKVYYDSKINGNEINESIIKYTKVIKFHGTLILSTECLLHKVKSVLSD